MSWSGTTTTSDQLTLTSSWQTIKAAAADMTVSPGSAWKPVHFQFQCDFQTSPTDEAFWQILTSVDGTNWDAIPVTTSMIDNATDINTASASVFGYVNYKIQARTGTTDTANKMTVRYEVEG